MPPRRVATVGSSSWRLALMSLGVLLLIAGGVAGTLWGAGLFTAKSDRISREGQIAVPALARPVRAYEAISREDLLNPQTRQLNVSWLPADQLSPTVLRDLSVIIGRVVSRDKQPGYVLTERDLLPAGTRPGIAAGIPPGKRSLTVHIADVPGMELLRQGDRFDLLAVLPETVPERSRVEQAVLLGGVKPPTPRHAQLTRDSGIKPLVVGGTMVLITQGASRSTEGVQGLVADPTASRSRRQPEMVATIAVDPAEVAPLTEALALEAKLHCVARSGHADEEPSQEELWSDDGLVPVATLARDVSAFTHLTEHDLADDASGQLNVYYFQPEQVQPDWVTTFADLQGRIPARDLARGTVITEVDLMPRGTPAGIASAAPPGTSVLTVSDEALPGLSQLQPGNHFAVYQSLAESQRPSSPLTDWATLHGAVALPEDLQLQNELRQGIRLVVRDVVLLRSAGEDQHEVVVAVPEADVVSLSQALSAPEELLISAHSSQIPYARQAASRDVHGIFADGKSASIRLASAPATAAADRQASLAVPDGYRPVPVAARPVRAWSRLSVEDFIDAATGRPRILLFPEDRVQADWVTDLNQLIDRVVRHDLQMGRSVRESDLAPTGAQPDATSGIPAGMVGLSVTGDQILGLDESAFLRPGDRFRLVAAQPYDLQSLGGTVRQGLTGGDAVTQARQSGLLHARAETHDLVTEALLVEIGQPTQITRRDRTERTETTSQTVLTPDGPVRTQTTTSEPTYHESLIDTRSYLLALPADQVEGLTAVIAAGGRVTAVPLPGAARTPRVASAAATEPAALPGVFPTAQTTASAPRVIEHIRGNTVTREIWTGTRQSQQPTARPEASGESP